MRERIQIVWFKRDLRVHDHAPLWHAAQNDIPIIPLYVVEEDYWQQPKASRRHWHFIHDCLIELNQALTKMGQPLVIRVGDVTTILSDLNNEFDIVQIYAHEETGNDWTYQRDKDVIKWCRDQGVSFKEHPSNGVVRRLKNRDDWSAIRNKRMAQACFPKPENIMPIAHIDKGNIPAKDDPIFGAPVPGITQPGGRKNGVKTLVSFLSDRGKKYLYSLSAPGPSEQYCSRLSPHFTWGTLSIREVMQATQKRRTQLDEHDAKQWRRNLSAFVSRLSWHDHFIQKIEDQPSIEFQCMHSGFEGMREDDHNEAFLQAWQNGQTGYPFIDACMRSLVYQGWITFRMRAMLVSFASYDLWLDWRKTGHHLAQVFTDYEPGIHYSQLQMQSGVTGINAVRVYNPIKQSQEHDPKGVFIRRWLPELKNVSDVWIHEPWKMDQSLQKQSNCIIGKDYPAPIVDHKKVIKQAREKISAVRHAQGYRNKSKKVYQKLGSRKKPPSQRNNKYKLIPQEQLSLSI